MPLRVDVGTEPIPGYRLLTFLGEGGFGQIWKAEAPGGVEVALKFIRTTDKKAETELRALNVIRNIRHPHLLEMHFAVHVEDRLIIATSLCDRSLSDRFEECLAAEMPGIPREELLRYMRESAIALDFLNESRHEVEPGRTIGIQHRDIKPQNIFLVGGSVKVADFGLAKALHSGAGSHSGAMTPWYTPPETFHYSIASTSDQYSLAVMHYQLRCGELPFRGNVQQYVMASLTEDPVLTALPEKERDVIARALSKEPADRWPSCESFVEALTRAIAIDDESGLMPHLAQPASNQRAEPPDEEVNSVRTLGRDALHPYIDIESFLLASKETGEERRRVRASRLASTSQPVPLFEHGSDSSRDCPWNPGADSDREPPLFNPLGVSGPVMKVRREVITNTVGMKLALIPAGSFSMGSNSGPDGEKPVHQVHISQPFYLGKTAVTQGQWTAVMGTEPWKGEKYGEYVREGADYPATYVSWEDAMEFCRRLSARDARVYRLPTEAQWEYACRGGTTTEYAFGDSASDLSAYAWFRDNTWGIGEGYAHPVGQKKANGFGLYDMHGNVWEWCADWYGESFYTASPTSDPSGPPKGLIRVNRGGSWSNSAWDCRCADRYGNSPGYRLFYLGFRVASPAGTE
ncbi:Serine/threonine-protein kinase pkn1 [Planctomycetes bacterium Pan216]|uniref:Serine/threonine-protein kinase pkn1 n=1 Tax=Kolteria novifilia TaxID=2527975 RepID=A0A518B172_9BACT|nr:Serine/threonine-protein kinase pkn1 [Planctomycetes bacterium Pan216]